MQALIGIHLGLERTTAVMVEPDGSLLASSSKNLELRQGEGGAREQSPDAWWRSLAFCTRALLKKTDFPEVLAVGLCDQPNTVVPVDSRGHPLGNAMVQPDRRAQATSEELAKRLDLAEIHKRTGSGLGTQQATIKMAWSSKNWDPFKRCRQALSAGGWIGQRLVGRPFLDRTQASVAGFLDIQTGQFAVDLLQSMGVPAGKLPSLVSTGDVLGQLTSAASADTGIKAGTTLVAGLSEQAAWALATGLTEAGQALFLSNEDLLLVSSPHPVRDPRAELQVSLHPIDGLYLLELGPNCGSISERKAQLDKQGIPITRLVTCGSDAPTELSDLPWSRQDIEQAEAMGAVHNARSILE
ncbi:MAG: hypothetical protein JRF33_21425 [Deltaproteobacteria bacterium]|nr:hypothetical protein [Deltaproteobacteria bacterium]